MNLLLIGSHFSDKRHNQNAWQDIAIHLRNAGYGVITSSRKNNKILRLADMLLTIWQKRKTYHVAQVDVFSGQAFIWAYLSVKLLKWIKKPIILMLRGGNLPEYSRHHPIRVSWLLNHVNAVAVPSHYLLEAMQPYRDDLILIPNALDTTRYPYVKRISPKPILIWLRAFHEIYHPELAIHVLQLLHRNLPATRLIMIGPDKGDGSLQRTQHLAMQFGLGSYVEFPGGVSKNEVPIWLNKGDVFLNTTNIDNTPISVMEAMSCGLCVVSTNVGGMPYLIDNEEDGILIQPNDPGAMAGAVLQILREPVLAEKLSSNARKKAERFDWEIILPIWNDLLGTFQSGIY